MSSTLSGSEPILLAIPVALPPAIEFDAFGDIAIHHQILLYTILVSFRLVSAAAISLLIRNRAIQSNDRGIVAIGVSSPTVNGRATDTDSRA